MKSYLSLSPQGLETAKPSLAALTTNAASASSPVRLVLGRFLRFGDVLALKGGLAVDMMSEPFTHHHL
jgi:hypothetical protein